MNGLEFINQNISKKMGIAIITIVALMKVQAPPLYIAIVGTVAVVVQGFLDYGTRQEKTD